MRGRVSILIRPSGRMQLLQVDGRIYEPLSVSILIRPEGRMQLGCGFVAGDYAVLFQSSSGQKAGCNVCVVRAHLLELLFQSSSGQKAGCNTGYGESATHSKVSILIRPEGRMQLRGLDATSAVEQVSILIRPEGRMQHFQARARFQALCLFQSSSGQKAGCNPVRPVESIDSVQVSILIRPEGRMQRCPRGRC